MREVRGVDERLDVLMRDFAGVCLAFIENPNDGPGHVDDRSGVLHEQMNPSRKRYGCLCRRNPDEVQMQRPRPSLHSMPQRVMAAGHIPYQRRSPRSSPCFVHFHFRFPLPNLLRDTDIKRLSAQFQLEVGMGGAIRSCYSQGCVSSLLPWAPSEI